MSHLWYVLFSHEKAGFWPFDAIHCKQQEEMYQQHPYFPPLFLQAFALSLTYYSFSSNSVITWQGFSCVLE
jgi:hypothetical protein